MYWLMISVVLFNIKYIYSNRLRSICSFLSLKIIVLIYILGAIIANFIRSVYYRIDNFGLSYLSFLFNPLLPTIRKCCFFTYHLR